VAQNILKEATNTTSIRNNCIALVVAKVDGFFDNAA
jgi:hypothetical protein